MNTKKWKGMWRVTNAKLTSCISILISRITCLKMLLMSSSGHAKKFKILSLADKKWMCSWKSTTHSILLLACMPRASNLVWVSPLWHAFQKTKYKTTQNMATTPKKTYQFLHNQCIACNIMTETILFWCLVAAKKLKRYVWTSRI